LIVFGLISLIVAIVMVVLTRKWFREKSHCFAPGQCLAHLAFEVGFQHSIGLWKSRFMIVSHVLVCCCSACRRCGYFDGCAYHCIGSTFRQVSSSYFQLFVLCFILNLLLLCDSMSGTVVNLNSNAPVDTHLPPVITPMRREFDHDSDGEEFADVEIGRSNTHTTSNSSTRGVVLNRQGYMSPRDHGSDDLSFFAPAPPAPATQVFQFV
jgi:hypothetical protein